MKRVLFVGHDASRTGAPILLLNLLKWLARSTSIEARCILGGPGPLLEDYARCVETLVYEDLGARSRRGASWLSRLPKGRHVEQRIRRHHLRNWVSQFDPELIYVNTLATGHVLSDVAHDAPILVHVHELATWIATNIGESRAQRILDSAGMVIAVSKFVARELEHRVSSTGCGPEVIYEYLPLRPDEGPRREGESIRAELGIAPDAIIVGASGTTDWRKGADLFVQLALYVAQRQRAGTKVHFVWVGGNCDGAVAARLQHDIDRCGLADAVHFLGHRADPLGYFAAFDIFALLSREDPYPLVVLEAASLGKPIVCFENAGGAPEFVEDDSGFVVPYLDMPAMAERIVELLHCENLRTSMGKAAAAKVRARHDIEDTGLQLLNAMSRCVASRRSVME